MSSRLITLIGLISLQVAAQSVPTAINFQSRLTTNDTTPQPVNGSKQMSFSIWDAVSSGTSLWSQAATAVPVTEGQFSVILGATTPIPAGVFTGGASRFVEITVEGETLTPRQRLVTAPYAFMSEFAAGFPGAQYGVLGTGVFNPPVAPPGNYPVGAGGWYDGAGIGFGLYGKGPVGVFGNSAASGYPGVLGYGLTGVEGQSDQAGGVGIQGDCTGACNPGGYAGKFGGNVQVSGTASANTVSTVALNASNGTITNQLTVDSVSHYGIGPLNLPSGFHAISDSDVGGTFTVNGLMTTYNGITLAGANSTVTVDSVNHLGAGPLNLPSGFHAINNSDVGGAFTVTGLMTTNNGITLQGANSTLTVDSIKHFGSGPVNLPDGFHTIANSDVGALLTAFSGNITTALTVGGNLGVGGSLSVSGTKNFRIDHPLDPQCKFLYHASIESSEVLNLYSGNVVTDAQGLAEVALPEWFEALNSDFRYQLTPVGQFSQAIIEREIRDHRFTIRTDKPGVKVSWQVTGVRSDPAAHGFRVEEEKPAAENGRCMPSGSSPATPRR